MGQQAFAFPKALGGGCWSSALLFCWCCYCNNYAPMFLLLLAWGRSHHLSLQHMQGTAAPSWRSEPPWGCRWLWVFVGL